MTTFLVLTLAAVVVVYLLDTASRPASPLWDDDYIKDQEPLE